MWGRLQKEITAFEEENEVTGLVSDGMRGAVTNKEISEIVTNDVKEDPGVGVGEDDDDQDVGVEASGAVTNDGGVGDDQDDGVGVRKNCYEMEYVTDGGKGWSEAVTEDA